MRRRRTSRAARIAARSAPNPNILRDVQAWEREHGVTSPAFAREVCDGDAGTFNLPVLVARGSLADLRAARESCYVLHERGMRYVGEFQGRLNEGHAWERTERALSGHDAAAADRVRELAEIISAELPPLPSRRRRRVWSDDGSDYDFDRLQDFHERPASARKRTVRSDPGTVHLVACYGGSGATTEDELQWAGAPCLAVARALLDAGYSVSLDATRAVQCEGYVQSEVVRILDAGTGFEVDFAAVASVVCDGNVFRHAGFAFRCVANPLIPYNLGSATMNPAKVYQGLAERGSLPAVTWAFDLSYSRTAAIDAARSGLRAIIDRIAPESALSALGSHDLAMSQREECAV